MVSDTQQIPAGYKQTDVGVIPNDWEVVELQRLALDMLQGINTAIDKPEYVSDGVPMFKANNIIDQTLSYTNMDYISYRTYSRYSERFKIKKNDFLFSNIGARLGTGSLFTGNEECSFAWNVMRIVPNEELVNPAFLAISINSPKISDEIKNNQSGSGMGFVPKGVMKKIGIPLPEKKEQEKITEVLSDIDSLISKLDQLIQKKKNIKQGAMQELLTGKRRLPGFSGVWEDTTLEELERAGRARLFRGKVISKKDIDQFPGSYPIYSSSINNNGKFGQYGKHMFNEELITWSVDGGGNFFYRPKHKFSVTNVCGYIRLTTSSIRYDFLAFQLQQLHSYLSFDYTMKAHPSVIRKAYSLKLPSVEEQAAIAQILLEMGVEIEALEVQKTKYINLKQGMMQQLLTGKIRLI